MKRITKAFKIARIYVLVWAVKRSGYIAWKCGCVGLMGATVTEGRYKGWPLRAVFAIEHVQAQ